MSADLVIVPADDMSALESMDPAGREVAVTLYLTDARDRLALALVETGPAQVAAIKAEVATAAEATKQLGLSKEIQADALEMVRRCEYALAKAIRAGQEAGTIKRQREGGGWPSEVQVQNTAQKTTARDYFNNHMEQTEAYAMADGAETDEQFEKALTEARAEGNLSRANVVRKIKDVPAPQSTTRPEILRGTHHLIADRVIDATVLDASNVVSPSLLAEINLSELDRNKLGEWISSLSGSIRALQALRKSLEKELNRG